jgi:hypothetical protein
LDAKKRGELIQLRAGDRRTYDLKLGALEGELQIERFASRVATLAG